MYTYLLLLWTLCSLLGWHGPVLARETSDKGTLIVSYQVGPKADRLGRVHFQLIDDNGDAQLYPKGKAYVEDEHGLSRMVAIENLSPGKYTVKFLVPNPDGLFDDVPVREIEIHKNEVCRIDEHITPRYAALKVKAVAQPDGASFKTAPTITLQDAQGNIRAQSTVGKLASHYLEPGSYKLSFEPQNNFHTPEAIDIELGPNQHSGLIIGTYIAKEAPLIQPSTPQLEEVAAAEPATVQRPSYYTGGAVIINQSSGQLTVESNQPDAQWTLLRFNVPVRTVTGSIVNMQVPDGDGYQIKPQLLEGYTVSVSPAAVFPIYFAQTVHARIIYKRTTGSISLDSAFPDGATIGLSVTSKDSRPLNVKLKSQKGRISWQSPSLPTGPYEVTYSLPQDMAPLPAERFYLRPGERHQLSPKFALGASLRIAANVPEAIYLLRNAQGQTWKGQGRDYTFRDIEAGSYTLSFSTQDQNFFIPPKDMRVYINSRESKEVRVDFELAGQLVIEANVDNAAVTIRGSERGQRTIEEALGGRTKTLTLPQGRYQITASAVPMEPSSPTKMTPPGPVEVTIKPFSTERVSLNYKSEANQPVEKTRRLTVNANISEAKFTVRKAGAPTEEIVGTFSGKAAQIDLPSDGDYEVVFESTPNYQAPATIAVAVPLGEEKTVLGNYTPVQAMVNVPAGKAIIGSTAKQDNVNELPAKIVSVSAFELGAYEVTNAQYARWLNDAMQAKTIAYASEADKIGSVLDHAGNLLFRTFESDRYSQITAQSRGSSHYVFTPIPGKDTYPVINVTWYGAMAYCKDNQCRLPSEAEWEKGAGMQPEANDGKLTKFIYGFGQDAIDRTWANYKDSPASTYNFQVLTTPVGFYNGINMLPLSASSRTQQQTHLAKSPYGAYDMSGNVWEWVSDWYDEGYYKNMSDTDPKGPESGTSKVVKGGCYDSLADGVRVSERLGLPPNHADAFTGFRIAIDK